MTSLLQDVPRLSDAAVSTAWATELQYFCDQLHYDQVMGSPEMRSAVVISMHEILSYFAAVSADFTEIDLGRDPTGGTKCTVTIYSPSYVAAEGCKVALEAGGECLLDALETRILQRLQDSASGVLGLASLGLRAPSQVEVRQKLSLGTDLMSVGLRPKLRPEQASQNFAASTSSTMLPSSNAAATFLGEHSSLGVSAVVLAEETQAELSDSTVLESALQAAAIQDPEYLRQQAREALLHARQHGWLRTILEAAVAKQQDVEVLRAKARQSLIKSCLDGLLQDRLDAAIDRHVAMMPLPAEACEASDAGLSNCHFASELAPQVCCISDGIRQADDAIEFVVKAELPSADPLLVNGISGEAGPGLDPAAPAINMVAGDEERLRELELVLNAVVGLEVNFASMSKEEFREVGKAATMVAEHFELEQENAALQQELRDLLAYATPSETPRPSVAAV